YIIFCKCIRKTFVWYFYLIVILHYCGKFNRNIKKNNMSTYIALMSCLKNNNLSVSQGMIINIFHSYTLWCYNAINKDVVQVCTKSLHYASSLVILCCD